MFEKDNHRYANILLNGFVENLDPMLYSMRHSKLIKFDPCSLCILLRRRDRRHSINLSKYLCSMIFWVLTLWTLQKPLNGEESEFCNKGYLKNYCDNKNYKLD